MNILFNIVISIVASAVVFLGGVNVPAKYLSLPSDPLLGNVGYTSITTATNLASFPDIYNANLTAIDNGKTDSASTSIAAITTLANLSTVGTITSGTWNGTAVGVAYGGTGTTSPTSNQVMLGNGSSGFKVIGFGTSGQFLTSGGAATAPSWTTAAIDQTANYNWTGTNLFKNFNASSTAANPITLNGLSYSTPSVRAASSTILMEDGSGGLTWNSTYSNKFLLQTTPVTGTNATTTIFQATVPAGALSTNNSIRCDAIISDFDEDGNNVVNYVAFGYGTGTTTASFQGVTTVGVIANARGTVTLILSATGATNSQRISLGGTVLASVTPAATVQPGVGFAASSAITTDSTVSQPLRFEWDNETGDSVTFDQVLCELVR